MPHLFYKLYDDQLKNLALLSHVVIRCDLDSLMIGWSLEEAEVAARDLKIWGHFLRQAAGAQLHDTI